MAKIISSIFILLVFCGLCFAQQRCPEEPGNPHFFPPENESFSTEKLRLDEAAEAVKINPQKKIFFIVYGKSFSKNSKAVQRIKMSEQYLIKKHNIEKKRIVALQGGIKNSLQMIIFVIYQNLEEQPCNERTQY
jgi:hypothetical protein